MKKRTADPNQLRESVARGPGRPPKFGRPSRVVALTLPEDAIDQLRHVHRDLGWAIVKLLDHSSHSKAVRCKDIQPDVELVTVADRRSLIVVNRELIRHLPGVNILPLNANRAFLALDIDRGMSDLELAATDRLADPTVGRRERQALAALRAQLTRWRRDHDLQFRTRAIIVVERLVKKPSARDRAAAAAARGAAMQRAAEKDVRVDAGRWRPREGPRRMSLKNAGASGPSIRVPSH